MLLRTIFPALVVGLAGIAAAVPLSNDGLELLNITLPPDYDVSGPNSPQGYDPSFDYFDYTTVQIWLGKDKVTVGDMTGSNLYGAVYSALDRGCQANSPYGRCHSIKNANWKSRCVINFPGLFDDCWTDIWEVRAHWDSEKIRRLLIGMVAGALEQVTRSDNGGNCFDMAGTKGCNVGDVVRVNFPIVHPTDNDKGYNYMHIRLWNSKTGYGDWNCCQGDKRDRIRQAMYPLGNEMLEAFPFWKIFTQDVRCIIDKWVACP